MGMGSLSNRKVGFGRAIQGFIRTSDFFFMTTMIDRVDPAQNPLVGPAQ